MVAIPVPARTATAARSQPAPTLRPGLLPLWRSRGESQIGADPRLAIVLTGLTAREQRFLDSLAWPRPRALTLRQAARQHGVHPDRAAAITAHLLAHGCLAQGPAQGPAQELSAGGRVSPGSTRPGGMWRAGADRVRAQAGVAVVTDAHSAGLGLELLCLLAAEGVGRLGLVAPGTVSQADVLAGFDRRDLGLPRDQAVIARLRAVEPLVDVDVADPDVVVVVESRVSVPFRSSALVREGVTHLSVVTREIDVVIGPLVRPGRDACLRCLDLTRTDRDPAWPAVATQLAAGPARDVGPAARSLAAAQAALEVLDAVDGRDCSLGSRTLEVGARSVPVTREWAPHPACGCGAHAADRADGRAEVQAATLRGRPRPRLRATTNPSTNTSPPQTPHGS